jgi:hypothetical protein
MTNIKHQLYNTLNEIITFYNKNGNIHRFYNKLSHNNKLLSQYVSTDIYYNYKIDLKIVYDEMINGDDYSMIVNDCINSIQRMMIELLVFE